jgi:hypothetical protein
VDGCVSDFYFVSVISSVPEGSDNGTSAVSYLLSLQKDC